MSRLRKPHRALLLATALICTESLLAHSPARPQQQRPNGPAAGRQPGGRPGLNGPQGGGQTQGVGQLQRQGQPQRQGQASQAGGAGPGNQQRVPPLVAALDSNSDSIISKEEIANAYRLLKSLDRNGDGKLSANEFRGGGAPSAPGQAPAPGASGQGRPGQGQPGMQRQGGGPGLRGANGGPPSDAHTVSPRDMPDRPRDIRFRSSIEVGSRIPGDIEIYNTQQQRIPMNELFADRPTVVVCGCLTCPAFLTAYPEVEAVYTDYKDKVDFYFLYHVLAHPENRGYLQPMTIEERFLHIKEAQRTLGTSIPWIADSMENELKEMYVWASNPEFIFAADGTVVHREPWSRGTTLRQQLEKLVGPSARVTTIADLKLPTIERVSEGNREGQLPRVQVQGMAVPLKFDAASAGQPWYCKMRPEADQRLVNNGEGQMYLGLHLDPIHQVHWNNLAGPVTYQISGPTGVQITPAQGEGVKAIAETDHDPREFLIDIKGWTTDGPLTVTVNYMACSKVENWCKPVRQTYAIYREANPAGGRVNGRSHMTSGGGAKAGGGARGGQRGGRRSQQ